MIAISERGASAISRKRTPAFSPQISSPLPPVTVHVFSDVSCPWCHIGARRLQRAVRQYKRQFGQAAPLQLKWNPLLTQNDVSTTGEDVDSYAGKRWGDPGQMRSRLVRAGMPEGANFRDWKTIPNSLPAHQLVALASEMGLADQANELLFARTYEQGRNISLVEELLDVGEALGMPRAALRQELMRGESSSVRASVLEKDAAAKRRLRIRAVPYFIVTGGPNSSAKYSLDGSHQTSDLLGAMQRVAAEVTGVTSTATETSYGAMLGAAARSAILPVGMPTPALVPC